MRGNVVHFEVPAKDMKRAQKFYSDVFGWQINEIPEDNYTMVGTTPSDENGMPKEPGSINGGIGKKTGPLQNPVITIQVDSIEEALKTVQAHGGKLERKKMAVGNMGWAAYFKDTEGNVMGRYQGATQ
jgi:hypothetical protein